MSAWPSPFAAYTCDVLCKNGVITQTHNTHISVAHFLLRLKKMNKYAKWRATEIGKAIREGQPIPLPPSGVRPVRLVCVLCVLCVAL